MGNHRVVVIAPKFYGLDESIRRAFERHGYESYLINPERQLWERVCGKITGIYRPTKAVLNHFLLMGLQQENERYLSVIKKVRPTFVFIVKGESILPRTIRIWNKEGIPCISYQWDDPFYSSEEQMRIDDYRRNSFLRSMNNYDYIFVFDKHYLGEITKRGIKHVSYLPLATDDEVYKGIELKETEKDSYAFDVCFVGMPYNNRYEIFNSLTDFNIGVFGDNWERYLFQMKGGYYKGKAYGDKVLKLYAASNIILNIHHPQSISGLNTRTFDIPSCGSFQIVDYKESLGELFEIDKEIVCYRDNDELKSKIQYYLKNPEERKRIAQKGYLRVRGQHTWYHRVKEVVKVLK